MPGRSALAILASAAFLLTLAGSALKNTFQVYFLPIAHSFGVSRSGLAWAATLFAVTTALASPLVGGIADRIGGARTLAVGTFLAGLAMIGCALSGQLWLFVVVYCLVAALAVTMLSYVPLGVFVDQLFQDGRKGLSYALITNGAAVGFVVLVPLWSWLGGRYSWQTVLEGIGVVFLVVLTPLSLVLARQSDRLTASKPAGGAEDRPGLQSLGARVRLCLRAAPLRRLALAFVGCGFTMAFIDVHFVPLMTDHHMGGTVSSSAVAVLGVFEIAGSLLAGWLCDRKLVKQVLVGAYAARCLAMLLVWAAPSQAGVMLFGIVFGLSYLASVIASSLWIAQVLPAEVRGTAMGLTWMVHALGVAGGSQLGAVLRDMTGSYQMIVLICAALTAGSALIILSLGSPFQASRAPQPTPEPVA
ncbi:MFS transporter [Kitasatospora sp. RB6PN24]|uniref:MFS transporter n=1 Tax=Kitasatospora humi TaxID=2893891 RepID=UPI001E47C80F|nr:MFS transporter [Kitasatospora humi]MCC9305751.1 MFS transporter [Kitasatospora humi]